MGAPKVTHWEVTGKDGAKLQTFFTEVFGWKVDSNNPMDYGMVEGTGGGIGGGISNSEDGSTQVTFYIEVDDVQAYLDKAVQAGGSVAMPVMAIPDGPTIAQFTTPEGHAIGLVKEQA